jgi:hypothetical protein
MSLSEFRGVIDTDGKFIADPSDRAAFRMHRLRLKGERVVCAIHREKTRRSSQANRFYWGVVIAAFCEATGYEPDEMHELLAMKFLRIEDDPLTGMPRRKRTPKCNTEEFSEYVNQCQRFGAVELGLEWPEAA